jgi:hypothetical protein
VLGRDGADHDVGAAELLEAAGVEAATIVIVDDDQRGVGERRRRVGGRERAASTGAATPLSPRLPASGPSVPKASTAGASSRS